MIMNKRIRKKWLKQHNRYINPKECWNLNITFAEFILPRLKRFKKDTNCYPCNDEITSPEDWDNILDKMILAFEYILEEDNWCYDNPQYDYSAGLHMKTIRSEEYYTSVITEEEWVEDIRKACELETERRQNVIDAGLGLFAKYYEALWW